MRYKSIHCVAHFVYFVLSGFALALSILNRKSYRPKSHCTEQLLKIWSSRRLSLSLSLSIYISLPAAELTAALHLYLKIEMAIPAPLPPPHSLLRLPSAMQGTRPGSEGRQGRFLPVNRQDNNAA